MLREGLSSFAFLGRVNLVRGGHEYVANVRFLGTLLVTFVAGWTADCFARARWRGFATLSSLL